MDLKKNPILYYLQKNYYKYTYKVGWKYKDKYIETLIKITI